MDKRTYDEYLAFFEANGGGSDFLESIAIPDKYEINTYLEQFNIFLSPEKDEVKCVLGIDIYKYSQYQETQQKIIPFLFHHFINESYRIFRENEPMLSLGYDNLLWDNFIDTGDGGYFIFNTPIDALAFLQEFSFVVHVFNSFCLYPKIRALTGPITFRSAFSFEKLYIFNNNSYGSAIINCSRILSKDKLNRCLLDENTMQWFLIRCNGIETLNKVDIKDIKLYIEYRNHESEVKSKIFVKDVNKESNVLNTIINQKIGDITVKSTNLSIYSLYCQFTVIAKKLKLPSNSATMTIAIGNLNTHGLE